MKTFSIRAFFVAFFLVFFVACGDGTSKSNVNENASTNKTKKIIVGINANYPPFEYEKDSEIVGFDVDLLNEIAKNVGFTYEFSNMSFDALIPAISAGKVDLVISSMSATDERRKVVDFSVPYYEGRTVYVKRKDDISINSKDDLKGKVVGVYAGTLQEAAALKMNELSNVVITKDITTSFLSLNTKKVDVVMADSATSNEYIKQYDNLVGFLSESDGSDGLAIALPKGKDPELLQKINSAIENIKSSQKYKEIIQKNNLE